MAHSSNSYRSKTYTCKDPLGGGCAPSTPALIKVGEGRPFLKRLTSVGMKWGAIPDCLKARLLASNFSGGGGTGCL
jgi:hypothetical protein